MSLLLSYFCKGKWGAASYKSSHAMTITQFCPLVGCLHSKPSNHKIA